MDKSSWTYCINVLDSTNILVTKSKSVKTIKKIVKKTFTSLEEFLNCVKSLSGRFKLPRKLKNMNIRKDMEG